jgi:hypothetical protein
VQSLPTVKPALRPGRKAPERAKSARHDSLHIEISGLSYCWCKCADCWRNSFPVGRAITGFCICQGCPCRRETAAALRAVKIPARGGRGRVR